MIWLISIFFCLLLVFVLLLAIPVCVLALQVCAAFLLKAIPIATPFRGRVAVLIPAHNEGNGIQATIENVRTQLRANDRLVVVADNCIDDTAAIAALAGAEVVQRFDNDRRGKGYALDFGVMYLASDAPEVVIIVDADCLLEAGAVDRLASTALATDRAVQALYLMHAPAEASALKKIAQFAWLIKNWVRPLGFYHLGLPCQLMGTGMAFPWHVLTQAELASGHIVEDMKLGVDLARMDAAPLFCPKAIVYSHFPNSTEGANSQRTRWEHGHLSMIVKEVPGMLAFGLRSGKLSVIAMALDLCVPPIALLVMLQFVSLVLSLIFFLLINVPVALIVSFGSCAMLGLSIFACWWRYGRTIVGFSSLAMALWYAFRKIPLYVKFLVGRQVEWVRSKRDGE